jgi:hypothetical protein
MMRATMRYLDIEREEGRAPWRDVVEIASHLIDWKEPQRAADPRLHAGGRYHGGGANVGLGCCRNPHSSTARRGLASAVESQRRLWSSLKTPTTDLALEN